MRPRGRQSRNPALRAARLGAAGVAAADTGALDRAVEFFSDAIRLAPDSASGLNNLGLALQQRGDLEAAVAFFRRAIALSSSYVLALTNLGAALGALGRHEEALEPYESALECEPRNAVALNNLGAALIALGRFAEAVGPLESVASVEPGFPEAHANLGRALMGCHRNGEAQVHLEEALSLQPGDAMTRVRLGQLLLRKADYGGATTQFSRPIALAPSLAEAHAGLARALQELGDIEAARARWRVAIAAEPDRLCYYLGLVRVTRLKPDAPEVAAMLSLAGEVEALPEEDQIDAHFALAKVLSDLGRNEEAFAHQLAGNAIRRRSVDYDERRTMRGFQRIKERIGQEQLARWPTGPPRALQPIFIVGMPRSGSTLVEQFLSQHPAVACGGESDALAQTLKEQRGRGWKYPDADFAPTAEQVARTGDAYLARLREGATQERPGEPLRVTDKALTNFKHLGLISRLFPDAPIIHTFRDPLEGCLSCFSINFASQPFAFDLGELGRYYRAYAVMMRHWKRTLPAGAFLDVRYEAVALDFERSARAIVAHCGLAWDERCLRFHEARRPVRTASVEQVRRPVYQSSVRRWRPSSEALRPLLEGLGLPAGAPLAKVG